MERETQTKQVARARPLSWPCSIHPACTIYHISPRRASATMHVRTLSAMQRRWDVVRAIPPRPQPVGEWRRGLKQAIRKIWPRTQNNS